MTSRSSIFSFNTLRTCPVVPATALSALALLAVAEIGARTLVATGKLEEDPSLRKTLVSRLDQIQEEKPPIWMVGNSTLDWGVQEDRLAAQLDSKLIKLAHGSATLNASAAMLEFYIRQTGQRPEHVIVTLTMDDLNRNGYRAQRSETYLELARANEVPEGDWLMLRRARSNIRDGAVDLIESLKPHKRGPRKERVKRFDGKVLTAKDTFELSLLKGYETGTDWFAEFKAVCDRNGIPAPIIVLMPSTDRYFQFHDEFVESPKSDEVRAEVLAAIAANGMTVIDYWQKPRTDYSRFRDSYHLNPEGAEKFTSELAGKLRPLLAAQTPAAGLARK